MVAGNIDLTENRDFRGGRFQIPEMDIPLELWDEDIMTSEDYEKIRRWESIFGKKRHTNGKYRIFGITPFVKNLESRCCRCGKEFKIPWERERRELCKRCSDEVEHDNQYLKFPWNYMKLSVRRIGDRGQGNLFDLR